MGGGLSVVYHPIVVTIIIRIIVFTWSCRSDIRSAVAFHVRIVASRAIAVVSVTIAIAAVPWNSVKSSVLGTQIHVAITLIRVTAPDWRTPRLQSSPENTRRRRNSENDVIVFAKCRRSHHNSNLIRPLPERCRHRPGRTTYLSRTRAWAWTTGSVRRVIFISVRWLLSLYLFIFFCL